MPSMKPDYPPQRCSKCSSENVVFSKKRSVNICEDCGHEFADEKRFGPLRIFRYRLLLVKDGTLPTTWDRQLRQSGDVAKLMADVVAGLDREAFFVVLLDGKNRVSGINLVSLGSLTAALVHPREVFKAAIAGSAAALVLVHNHPSGDPSPSAEDRAITERLSQVGELVGIRVLDHIVLGDDGAYTSFADDGLLGGAR